MSVINIKNNFKEEVIKSTIPVLVDFNANWCGPCQRLKPIIEELSEEIQSVKFVSIDVDYERDLAEYYNIMSIPCLLYFVNGEEKNRLVGLKSKEEIKKLIGE